MKIILSFTLYFQKLSPEMTFQSHSIPKAQCRGHPEAHPLLSVSENRAGAPRKAGALQGAGHRRAAATGQPDAEKPVVAGSGRLCSSAR